MYNDYVMQKLVLCLICIVSLSTYSSAQNATITGIVKDSISGVSIAYVQVVILDETTDKYVSMGITGEKGDYEIDELPLGNYYMKVMCLGYKTKFINGIKCIPEQKKLNIDIQVSVDVKVLDAAVITADRTTIEFRPDKRIINIDPAATAGGASVAEFLKSIPEIKVEGDEVTLKTYTPTILVNGKPASAAMQDLTHIPASLIASIEVITNPSVRYNPEGLGGIINLKTRRISEGINGMIQGSAGSNNQGNSAGTLNYKTKKWNTFINIFDRYYGTKISGYSNQQYDTGYSTSQTLSSKQKINRISTRVGADYEPDSLNVFTLYWEFSSRTGTIKNNNNYEESGLSVNRIYASNQTLNLTSSDHEIGLSYVHNFKNTGELDVDLLQSLRREPTNVDMLFEDTVTLKYNTIDIFDTKESYVSINYSSPILKTWELETGAAFDLEQTEVESSLSGTLNSDYNNVLNMTELMNTCYLSLEKSFEKLSIKAGLRGEYTNRKLYSIDFQPNRYNYFNIFPNLGLNYQINDNFSVNMSYGRRIKRPGILALTPYASINYYNLSERFIGNPDLKPAYTNSVDLGGNRKWTKLSMSASASYMRTNNDIADVYYTKDDLIYNTRKNISTTQKILFYTNMDYYSMLWNIYRPILTVSLAKELYDTPSENGDNIHKSFFNYNFSLNNVLSLPEKWNVSFVATYYPRTHMYASTTEDITDLKLTLRKTFKNNLTLMAAFYNILNSKTVIHTYGDGFTAKNSIDNNTQAVYFGIMYKFGETIKTRANVDLNLNKIETQ